MSWKFNIINFRGIFTIKRLYPIYMCLYIVQDYNMHNIDMLLGTYTMICNFFFLLINWLYRSTKNSVSKSSSYTLQYYIFYETKRDNTLFIGAQTHCAIVASHVQRNWVMLSPETHGWVAPTRKRLTTARKKITEMLRLSLIARRQQLTTGGVFPDVRRQERKPAEDKNTTKGRRQGTKCLWRCREVRRSTLEGCGAVESARKNTRKIRCWPEQTAAMTTT